MRGFLMAIMVLGLMACTNEDAKITEVANFKGEQVTGVSVSEQGRIFANFPRWREGVKNSVVEVMGDGQTVAFPNAEWNAWALGDSLRDDLFVAVQSVVAHGNTLYVLDTRNALFNGVMDAPRVFCFDLSTNKLSRTYTLSSNSYHTDSYINDLRIDEKLGKMYLSDSGHAGIVVMDLHNGSSFRVLDNHPSTLAEVHQLSFDNGIWTNSVHSDGIALDTQNNMLYFHALTGYSLYAVPTKSLLSMNNKEIEANVKLVAKTSAPDGMIYDGAGNLYLADLEHNKIMKYNIAKNDLQVAAEGEPIKWADTFSIHNKELYYTNSRINEDKGDISELVFTINKFKID